jgi:hypothetical protein
MKLVKEDKGQIEAIRNLSDNERLRLVEWYEDPESSPAGEMLLETIWSEHQWLACDCSSDMDNPPLMHARKLPGGGFTLVRMPERGRHEESCTFFYEPGMYAGLGGTRHKPLPLLTQILRHARLNHLPVAADEDEELLSDQYTRIRRAARSVELGEGIYLHWYLKMRLSDLNALAAKLRRETERFPEDAVPKAFLLLTSSSHSGRDLTVGSRHQEENLLLENPPKIVGEDAGGPYVALITLSYPDSGREGYISPRTAQIQSVVSRRFLMPVNTTAERKLTRKLIQLQHWLYEKHGQDYEIHRHAEIQEDGSLFELVLLNGQKIAIALTYSREEIDSLSEQDTPPLYYQADGDDEQDQRFGRMLVARILEKVK